MAAYALRVVPMQTSSRIYLTGFMGSGKSSLGPLLASAQGYSFVDLDEYIEEKAGLTIHEIFEQQGESEFRRVEKAALTESFNWTDTVIALGGGALVTGHSMDSALRNGLVVYLSASEETLIERIEQSGYERPLISNRDQLKTLLADREPTYRRAQIVFSTEGLDVSQAVTGLLAAIESSRQTNQKE